jgi:hypothetical protein
MWEKERVTLYGGSSDPSGKINFMFQTKRHIRHHSSHSLNVNTENMQWKSSFFSFQLGNNVAAITFITLCAERFFSFSFGWKS